MNSELKSLYNSLRQQLKKMLNGLNHLNNDCIPEYADNTAALAGDLIAGDIYKTTVGDSTFLKIVV